MKVQGPLLRKCVEDTTSFLLASPAGERGMVATLCQDEADEHNDERPSLRLTTAHACIRCHFADEARVHIEADVDAEDQARH